MTSVSEVRVQGDPLLLPLQTTLWVPVGHRALGIEFVAVHKATPPWHTGDDQALGALQAVTTPPISELLKVATSPAVSLLPPEARKAAVKKGTMLKWTRARPRA